MKRRFRIGTCVFIFASTVLLAYLYFGTNAFSAATPYSTSALGKPVPLFNASTKLDPPTILDTPEALITRVGDRARDRHCREWMFHAYDHYLALYWINRTDTIEIVDRVAKGGSTITFNMTSLFPLNGPNLRAFFQGKGTVAQYSDNMVSKMVDPLHYSITIKENTNERRPIRIGDRIEIEFSPFLKPPVEGRTNYYGTAMLYVVGTPGIEPWEWHTPVAQAEKLRGAAIDSYPLPDEALIGGKMMTLSQQYSDEPKLRFQQVATNMDPIDIQPFLLGRRLHHTDFMTGVHTEQPNPPFPEQAGKLGPYYTNKSCILCHVGNGAALPAAVGAPMVRYAVHAGSDAMGTPHPELGMLVQPQSITGKPLSGCMIASWTDISGTYADGTAYSLQKPNYKFTGIVPQFYSVRLAPQILGEGLLEAVDESTVAKLAVANSGDGIAGRMQLVADPVTGQIRMGRFDWKAGQPTLTDQIASALTGDMGVTNAVYPHPIQPGLSPSEKLKTSDLDNMYHYVALLGIPPRRDFTDPDVVEGQALFASDNCVKCHVDTMKTSPYHPLTELRDHTIHPYTDLLLHNMGAGLADNMGEGKASGADWRTPPLWGIGLRTGVSGGEAYLHDGRARTLSEAILWHGGEAEKSKEGFRKMSAEDRAALIKFLYSL